jgi:NAD(P)-dependent dehydrogenase (short-subunit alcohol dehydrogenase family)
MKNDIGNRIALVTGAAGAGMGRSIALTLAREGAAVVVNYRNSAEMAARVCATIEGQGGKALAVQADVFTEEGCRQLAEKTVAAFGRIDICVIGPGAGWHPEPPEALAAADGLADAACELAPVYHLMPLVLPGMYERKWGRVVGISLNPAFESPSYSYNTAKSARTKALLANFPAARKRGVTVNVIAPGPVEAIERPDDAVDLSTLGDKWRSRDNVSPQDIAEGVAFLCSEAGRFISGCVLPYVFN